MLSLSFLRRAPRRALPLTAAVLAGALGLTACGSAAGGSGGRTTVVAGFYPMAWLAESIGGDAVKVETLTRPGAEPHDLELTPRQIARVQSSDLTLYIKGVQPAVDDAVAKRAPHKSFDAVTAVRTLPAHDLGEEDEQDGHGGHGGGHGHADHADYDPHVWVDPGRMAAIAKGVGDRLAAVDPKHAADYRTRTDALVTRINALDAEFRTGLRTCARRTIVTSHAAFGYLADHYGLTQVPVAGVDPAAEPSPKRLARLSDQIRSTRATTVFTETLVSPKVADALAREAGVRTAVLDPAEGVRPGSSDDYLSVLRRDLATLRTALECS
ncbi:zinc ABC transporter substrate-binding protein [Actinomadura logoneensis]|uniref:Zinc ABC transporter substrate-binding protein n=1 Tax=Actinomadura logoneensis TaxID=2293572 RepID=A0A372JD41_9ACTN|nr:metal ABC transporter substrate-binding protein [Actinomadura logoneensis]RFU37925.1 zinc ABC transporter substrate-binding protein [Actinomadura logoneensis]